MGYFISEKKKSIHIAYIISNEREFDAEYGKISINAGSAAARRN